MANQVDSFPIQRFGKSYKYPWDEWADGNIWQIVEGEDYSVSPNAMATTLYAHANRTGKTVRVQRGDGFLTFQFTDPT